MRLIKVPHKNYKVPKRVNKTGGALTLRFLNDENPFLY